MECLVFLYHHSIWHVIILVGDTSASQVVGLTEEITAIVTNARPERGDKVRKTFSNLSVTK